MSNNFTSTDLKHEVLQTIEVPQHLGVLLDSRGVLVSGDPEGYVQFNLQQGDNSYGYHRYSLSIDHLRRTSLPG